MTDKHLFNDTVNLGVHTPQKHARYCGNTVSRRN